MRKDAPVALAALSLMGCSSNLTEFERELVDEDARAWELCKAALDNIEAAPPYGEKTDDHILFAWEGMSCKTNGEGTEIIDVTQ